MNHLTVAASERAFSEIFNGFRDNFSASTSGSEDAGPFTVDWSVGIRLENGSIDLQNDNSVRISELDIVYDPLSLNLGLDIPELCIGGFCIIPTPFGCALRAPRYCIFDDDPDVSIPLDIGGLVRSEISGAFRLKSKYFVDPARTPAMTNLDAEDAGIPNQWEFFLDPIWLDVDLIDIADTVGAILDQAVENAVNSLLNFLPGWARDLVSAILGSLVDLIRAVLDIVDDIDEWLSNLLGVSIGLFDFALTLVADYFAARNPIFGFEDPYPVLDYDGSLIPVKIPISKVDINVDDAEMVLSVEIGA